MLARSRTYGLLRFCPRLLAGCGVVAALSLLPVAANAQTGISSFYNSGHDVQEIFYIGTNQHIYESYDFGSGPTFSITDISGSTLPAAGSALTSFYNSGHDVQEIFYIGANQHVYEAYSFGLNSTFSIVDISGGYVAAAGSSLTSFYNPKYDGQEIFYIGANQHVYEAYSAGLAGTFSIVDVSGTVVAAAGSALTGFYNSGHDIQEVFYVGANQHVYEAYVYGASPAFNVMDISGATLAEAGSALSSFYNPAYDVREIFYIGANQHVYEAYVFGPSLEFNITDISGSTQVAAGSALTSFYNPGHDVQEIFYVGANQNVYESYDFGTGPTFNVTEISGSTLAVAGPVLTSFYNPTYDVQEIFYISSNQHVYESYDFGTDPTFKVTDISGSTLAASSYAPATPAKEYIYFNGQVIAIENVLH